MVIDAATAAGAAVPVGLVLVGEGRGCTALSARAAGSPHVVVDGPVRDRGLLARMMASADALVHGCEAETFSMVGAEAAASGTTFIAPDRGGAADHARAAGGRLYRAANVRSLRDELIKFAQTGRPWPHAFAPRAVRTMDEHFAELFASYEGLVGSRRLAA